MENISNILVLIGLIILAIIIFKIIAPYLIKMDTTLFLSGGLGSGKTLTGVIKAQQLIKIKQTQWLIKTIKIKIINAIRKNKYNKKLKQWKNKKIDKPEDIKLIPIKPKPVIYSNLPIYYKTINPFKKEWSAKLQKEHLILKKGIIYGSVIFIDEITQVFTQFDWNIDEIKYNVNELITFFRHYINGYLILTSQSDSDVVAQVRRKMNINIWCYDFSKFWIFYRNRMCDLHMSDQITNTSSTYISENTKWHYGIYLGFKFNKYLTYDTHAYSERYNNIAEKDINPKRFNKFKTNEIIRFNNYVSPLDDKRKVNNGLHTDS